MTILSVLANDIENLMLIKNQKNDTTNSKAFERPVVFK